MYFSTALPLRPAQGVSLAKQDGTIRRAELTCTDVDRLACIASLPWDRYMRLNAVVEPIKALAQELGRNLTIIDVGGFEGALALLLPEHEVYVADPATTGGSGLNLDTENQSFDVSVSIDVVEHLRRDERSKFLDEQARVARSLAIVGYPNARSIRAQEVVLEITDDRQIHEHVEFGLPKDDFVSSIFVKGGASVDFRPHTEVSLWATYACLSGLNSMAASILSKFLIENSKSHSLGDDNACVYQLAVARLAKK